MQKGQIVTIYEDPLTETKPEGKAELIKPTSTVEPELEYWKVRFLDDEGRTTHRFIKPQ